MPRLDPSAVSPSLSADLPDDRPVFKAGPDQILSPGRFQRAQPAGDVQAETTDPPSASPAADIAAHPIPHPAD